MNSTFNAHCANDNDLFEKINVDMSQHSKHGKILICGDLNANYKLQLQIFISLSPHTWQHEA